MNILDLIHRTPVPEPWAEGDNIPWNDPAFSERMLKEHLSQEHDLASRRAETIDAHVAWIHSAVLGGKPSRILDLGCGPGLYAVRLARKGHSLVGVDYAPAAVAYAREQAQGLDCRFTQADIREADYGTGYDLVMQIFGEINVFRPADARLILNKARAALKPGGRLLLEAAYYDLAVAVGKEAIHLVHGAGRVVQRKAAFGIGRALLEPRAGGRYHALLHCGCGDRRGDALRSVDAGLPGGRLPGTL